MLTRVDVLCKKTAFKNVRVHAPVHVCVCACIKIGDFLVRVAGLGISLGSD